MDKKTLLCFGFGFCASTLAKILSPRRWRVMGTHKRNAVAPGELQFNENHPLAEEVVGKATHVLFSIPPQREGDPAYRFHGEQLAKSANLRWAGYLSTTGVYGDCRGAWIDESRPPAPASAEAKRRLTAERNWRRLFAATGVAFQIFRLPGIYGAGRSQLERCLKGKARLIITEPNHFFSRIHAEDVAATLKASMGKPRNGAVYNVCDDEPAAGNEVVKYACKLLGLPLPPSAHWRSLKPPVLRFYSESRRIGNRLIKSELGVKLKYPNYRRGLEALARAIRQESAPSSVSKS